MLRRLLKPLKPKFHWPQRFCHQQTRAAQNLSSWASHSLNSNDTIYALSSASGRAGVSVVRISGPRATQVFQQMTIPPTIPAPRFASYRRLIEPLALQKEGKERDEIDRIIALYFQAPNSATGEDVVELHVHGSMSVINTTLASLASLNFGLAAPGEFTQRSFVNGKLDLSAVEGIADLINAETTQQRKQAIWLMDGNAERMYNGWAAKLAQALAKLEAVIDFGEDEHIDMQVVEQAKAIVVDLIEVIGEHLTTANRGEMIRSGIQVAIIGPPNSGKSSLLNRIAQRAAAIVSPMKGTTRDVVEVNVDLAGYPIKLCDTAGLNELADDEVELEGIRRSVERFRMAHLNIVMFDVNTMHQPNIDSSTMALLKDPQRGVKASPLHHFIFVFNKTDQLQHEAPVISAIPRYLAKEFGMEVPCHFVSCVTEAGIPSFLQHISRTVQRIVHCPGDAPTDIVVTRERHRQHLQHTHQALQQFLVHQKQLDIAAEDLRQAIEAIGKITGRVDSEDILDIVFRDFCIGK